MSDRVFNRRPTLADVIQQAITNELKNTHTAFPAKIVSFNPTFQTASIKPMIKRVFKEDDGSDASFSLPILINAPVWLPRAGGFVMTFPIKPGDDCLVVCAERSIDNWWTFGTELPPKDVRFHGLSDAIVLCGVAPKTRAITDYNENDLVLRKESNDSLMAVRDNGDVELQSAGSTITIKPSGDITISSPTKIILDAPVVEGTAELSVGSHLIVLGDADIAGNSNASDNVSSGISGNSHVHGGVQSGGSNTGGPQ